MEKKTSSVKAFFRKLSVIGISLVMLFGIILALATDWNTSAAVKAVEDEGYQNVKVTGTHRWLSARWFYGCGKDDWKATKVSAINNLGKEIEITVCEGFFFKAITVRH